MDLNINNNATLWSRIQDLATLLAVPPLGVLNVEIRKYVIVHSIASYTSTIAILVDTCHRD